MLVHFPQPGAVEEDVEHPGRAAIKATPAAGISPMRLMLGLYSGFTGAWPVKRCNDKGLERARGLRCSWAEVLAHGQDPCAGRRGGHLRARQDVARTLRTHRVAGDRRPNGARSGRPAPPGRRHRRHHDARDGRLRVLPSFARQPEDRKRADPDPDRPQPRRGVGDVVQGRSERLLDQAVRSARVARIGRQATRPRSQRAADAGGNEGARPETR